MNIIRVPRLMLLLCLFIGWQAMAGEKGSYQNWNTELNGNTNEAYTVADSKTSFGVFCSGEQCMFYLHQELNCSPGSKYSVLMNSQSISTALIMECTLINGNVFQILSPFNAVLKATQVGDGIGFAVALQSGAFAVTQFSLIGAKPGIERVLNEAASIKKREQAPIPLAPPQIFIVPPIQIVPPNKAMPNPAPNQNQKPLSKDVTI